jgi:hypothetical protein
MRLAFWFHLTTMYPALVFMLLWGYPFLTAQGLSAVAAGTLLAVQTLVLIGFAPVVGAVGAHRPQFRLPIGAAVLAATLGAWTLVLVWPRRAPTATLFVLGVVLGTNQPTAAVAFDLARDGAAPYARAFVAAVVNSGGFLSALAMLGLVGAAAQTWSAATGSAFYSDETLTVALTVAYPLWALGAWRAWRWRHAAPAARSATG